MKQHIVWRGLVPPRTYIEILADDPPLQRNGTVAIYRRGSYQLPAVAEQ